MVLAGEIPDAIPKIMHGIETHTGHTWTEIVP